MNTLINWDRKQISEQEDLTGKEHKQLVLYYVYRLCMCRNMYISTYVYQNYGYDYAGVEIC